MKKKVFNIIQIGDKSNRLSRLFDIFIAIVICANILVTFLQTFDELAFLFPVFHVIEVITILIFCVEYVLRIWTADYLYPDKNELRSRLRFLISFDGIIDLLTILPFFFLSGMVIFRMLRVARIFHLFRLNARYDSFNVITTVLYEKRNQIISSVFIVLILMLASSLCMYSVEHDSQPEVFRNAFSGIWWSMSTLLTVGYGDIYPITTLGRIMAICIAYLGVGAVAIPTGIISAGFVEQYQRKSSLSNIKEADIHEIAEIFVDKRFAGKSVEELEKYWENEIIYKRVKVNGTAFLKGISGRVFDLTLTIRDMHCDAVEIRLAKKEQKYIRIVYDPVHEILTFDRKYMNCIRDIVNERRVELAPKAGEITLRILMDIYSVEIFMNDGEKTLTSLFFVNEDNNEIEFIAYGGDCEIDIYKRDICRK